MKTKTKRSVAQVTKAKKKIATKKVAAKVISEALAATNNEVLPVVATNEAPTLSNDAPYTITDAVHDIIVGTETTGRAEAGFVSAIFNDEDFATKKIGTTWNNPINNYWNAPQRNTDKRGKRIPNSPDTRAQLANVFLLKFPEYSQLAVNYTAAVTQKTIEKKARNISGEINAAHAVVNLKKIVDAAQSMFNRAMKSVWYLRSINAVSVTLGSSNEITVKMPDDSVKSYRASGLRTLGETGLKKAGKIETVTRETAETTEAKPIVVDNLTAKLVAASFVEQLESNKLSIATESDETGTVFNRNDAAELALAIVAKFTREDTTDEELRGTLSQIFVALSPVLNVKTVKEASAIVKASANGG